MSPFGKVGANIAYVPVATDPESAVRSLMLLEGFDLAWHCEESADQTGYVRDGRWVPLFTPSQAERAQLVMDSINAHLVEGGCGPLLDLFAILERYEHG